MKTIYLRLFLFAIITGITFSCSVDDNVENLVPAAEADLGSLLKISGNGKLLGLPNTPNDLENSEITFSEFELDFEIEAFYEDIPDNVVQYELFKQYNGGQKVSVKTFEDVAESYTAANLEEVLSGLGLSESDLRIGDVFKYTVQMTQQNGEIYESLSAFELTVNCLSDLAGMYSVVTTNNTSGGSVDQGIEEIRATEIVGRYKTFTTGTWALGQYSSDQGYFFSDVCGTISVEKQNLFDIYSNQVYSSESSTGSVNGATGVITINYTIEFSSGNQEFTSVYTPQ